MRTQVEETIEVIRPALQADGGDIVLRDVDEATGIVTVTLIGACGTCPASSQTLKAGIERIMRDRIDGVTEVINVVPDEAVKFVRAVGYPIIVKPRAGAGASGTSRCDNDEQLAAALREAGVDKGQSVAVEEYIEGHEGFYDTMSIQGVPVLEFVSHYYPNVLEAMRLYLAWRDSK